MRRAYIFILLFFSACVAFAADPLSIHPARFGPEMHGLQLGMKMTWAEMLTKTRELDETPAAFQGTVTCPLAVTDNRKSVENLTRNEDVYSGNYVVIDYPCSGGTNGIINMAGGAIASKLPKHASYSEMFAILQKNRLNYASTRSIALQDERVIGYSLFQSKFNSHTSTPQDFAQWLSATYHLGPMEKKRNNYEASNPSEGWRVLIIETRVVVLAIPIPDSPKKR